MHLAGNHNPHRRRLRLHRPHLDWRGVGAHQQPVALRTPLLPSHHQRILRVARRMPRRKVHALEVVVVSLHLRPHAHRVAQRREDADNLIQRARNRMLGAQETARAGVVGSAVTVTVVSNTLETDGAVLGLGKTITKAGNGTWVLAGTTDNQGLTLNVSAGTAVLAKTSSGSVHAVGYSGMTVFTNGTTICAGSGVNQFINQSGVPLTLSGGLFDLAGTSQ